MQAADFHGAYGIVTVLETCIALFYSVRYYGSAAAQPHPKYRFVTVLDTVTPYIQRPSRDGFLQASASQQG